MKEERDPSHLKPGIRAASDRMKAPEELQVEDLLKAQDSIFAQIKRWQSISAAPYCSLAEILPRVNADTLRDIYRAHFLKPSAGKFKKQELVDRLLRELTNAENLKGFLLMQPDKQWAFIRDAMEAKELIDDGDLWDRASLARAHGYAYVFYHQGEYHYVVPDEIKKTFKQVDDEILRKVMALRSWLNQIACAAVNLYGALPLDDIARLVTDIDRADEDDRLTVDSIEFSLLGYSAYNDDYRIQDGWLASIDLTREDDDTALDMDAVRGLLEMRKGKPRYLPDMRIFLRYADPDYYEETPQIKALKKALREMGLSGDKAKELTDALHDKIAAEEDVTEVMHALEECGVELKSGYVKRIVGLIMEMFNATRIWRNFGHTPDEIVKIMGRVEPRAFHFGPGITEMFKRGDLGIDDLERESQGRGMINKDFKKSFMSEIVRIKGLAKSSAEAEEVSNAAPLHKPSRNDPCPCGSGLKYKKCCGKNG
jgi:hypothetical protein